MYYIMGLYYVLSESHPDYHGIKPSPQIASLGFLCAERALPSAPEQGDLILNFKIPPRAQSKTPHHHITPQNTLPAMFQVLVQRLAVSRMERIMRDFQSTPWFVVCELHDDHHQFQQKLRRIHEDPSRFLGADGGGHIVGSHDILWSPKNDTIHMYAPNHENHSKEHFDRQYNRTQAYVLVPTYM